MVFQPAREEGMCALSRLLISLAAVARKKATPMKTLLLAAFLVLALANSQAAQIRYLSDSEISFEGEIV
jgi:hypothetical protein